MQAADRNGANRRLTWKLVAFTAGSFAFGFALVPLYSLLCNITGARIGSRLAVRGGASLVRRIFLVLVWLLIGRLFYDMVLA